MSDDTGALTATDQMIDLARMALEFLSQHRHRHLPDIRWMDLEFRRIVSSYSQIELHTAPHGTEVAAAWASALGVAVQFEDCGSSVRCSVSAEFAGYSLRINCGWLNHGEAWRLLLPLDLELPDGGTVDVDPARLLPADAPDSGGAR
ncbi:MAG: hypothetical protein ACJ72N_07075 [Labedaea sp.]